ncbi:hypothetical protein K466DRAFT_533199 [Polyporus arcularius HHB13444]|uniref:Uncharacterized protein n=1 Tax=Polyporus arcularius HHB13444 TaxID=1314778 RepID=A0A5C3NUH6_9APHY|nr:hypothetical protein K466DRAFT_533199 [Polyporus arcularius HHB13444]
MPRLATDSSSSRRHNHQAVSGHHHSRLHTRSTRVDLLKRGESSSTSSAESSDPVDNCYDQNQASSSRTRWNARTSGNPYASRLLSKHGPAESEDLEEVHMHLSSAQERSADDEDKEQRLERAVSSEDGVDGGVEGDENGKADALRGQPEVGPDATMRDESKKKRTKARANANETVVTTAPDALALPPQDLLVSISRIAKLTDSLTSGASANDPTALPRWVQEAFKSDGLASSPEQWRADVLQSIRRVEGMLGRMVSEQLKVGQAEIEALREETARLEVRVRAVVEQQEMERLTRGAPMETVLQAGTSFRDSDNILPGSAPDSNSCPSDSDTEPDAEDHSLLKSKGVHVGPTATASSPSSTSSIPAPPVECTPSPESEAHAQSSGAPSSTNQSATCSYASKNLNVPPEPPEDPVDYLTKHPWSMLEVFLLLEVVAHFPAAEHGWTFVAEAYNNILITRPLQEWFSQQTAISNQEEAKMKTLLQKMNAEARRLCTPPTASAAPAKTPAAAPGAKGNVGASATFGSTEATSRAKSATHTTGATSPASSNPTGIITVAAKDAQIVTRLPFPLDDRSPASGPPSSQCIVPFPRRRPPFTLPSADAREFTRIMQSAAADVRPPSTESRAAMLSLYSSTKSRFSTRTSWDCWHRWCTPWVVQATPTEKPGQSPSVVVADYIVGNLGAPCGTSAMMRTSMFEYRPVPGTYPDAPGVQHRVTASRGLLVRQRAWEGRRWPDH